MRLALVQKNNLNFKFLSKLLVFVCQELFSLNTTKQLCTQNFPVKEEFLKDWITK